MGTEATGFEISLIGGVIETMMCIYLARPLGEWWCQPQWGLGRQSSTFVGKKDGFSIGQMEFAVLRLGKTCAEWSSTWFKNAHVELKLQLWVRMLREN